MLTAILLTACTSPEPERISIPDSQMPINTPEHEAIAQKYLYPLPMIFFKQFSPDDMSAFDEMFPSLFGHIYFRYNPDNDLGLMDQDTEVCGDVLEAVMMGILPFTPEQIRSAYARFYDAERHVYTATFGGIGSGGPVTFIITGSRTENRMLILSYDIYVGDFDTHPWPGDEFHWVLYASGETYMQVDGYDFKIISNALNKMK